MRTEDYVFATNELRSILKEFRDEAGRRIIAQAKAAWERGDKEFIVPPGTYNIYEPFPVGAGCSLEGRGLVILNCPCFNYFTTYPPLPPSDDYAFPSAIYNWNQP